MKFKFLFLIMLTLAGYSQAQVLSNARSVNWHLAGYRGTLPNYSTVIDISTHGGIGNGTALNDSALTSALAALNGNSGVIYFAAGIYLFHSTANLPANVILRGASSDSTTLKFDLGSGNSSDAITIMGNATATTTNLTASVSKDSSTIAVNDASNFAVGDYIKLSFNDSSLLFSSWAYGSVGQIIKIASINNNNITLESPLRMDYDIAKNPKITKLAMISGVGIECLKIERADSTINQTSNIYFNYATQCWVSGVESYMTNFAHIAFNNSVNCSVTGNYFHEAFAYGGGGQGYGVMCQMTTCECLIENNVFNHLRHSMIIQAGSNGNVYGYNYSINAYWTEQSLPANSAGDMVLHGNYAYCNLFEGNIGQNIVIDDSHGQNGPYNTYFRNRGELYGIFMNNNPASNNQNFIGNEVTNTGFFLGLYMLNGTGHFEYGNNVKGTIYASGTTSLADSSYYCNAEPLFMNHQSTWPTIGIPNSIGIGSNAAKDRYNINSYTTCSPQISTSSGLLNSITKNKISIYPNPSSNKLFVHSDKAINYPIVITLYNTYGIEVVNYHLSSNSESIDLSAVLSGTYTLRILDKTGNLSQNCLVVLK